MVWFWLQMILIQVSLCSGTRNDPAGISVPPAFCAVAWIQKELAALGCTSFAVRLVMEPHNANVSNKKIDTLNLFINRNPI